MIKKEQTSKMFDDSFEYRSTTNTFNILCDERKSFHTMQTTHIHDMHELYYLLSGERYYFIKDRTYHVKKGDFVLINRHDLHKTFEVSSPGHKRVLIYITNELMSEYHNSYLLMDSLFKTGSPVLRLNSQDQFFVESLLSHMLQSLKSRSPYMEISAAASLMKLLVFINETKTASIHDIYEHPSPVHEKISQIVHYINANFRKEISLVDVSSHFYLSPSYLSRCFKKATGFCFTEYLNSVRVKEAKYLLHNTKLSMTAIAEKTGYQSISHFGRVFKSYTGMSPVKFKDIK